MTSPKKPGVAFWAMVVVVAVLVAYPLSFGPACWINRRTGIGGPVLATIYRPVSGRLWYHESTHYQPPRHEKLIGQILVGYAEVGAPNDLFGWDDSRGRVWASRLVEPPR